MKDRIPIYSYGEFYDVPRQITFQAEQKWYYLGSRFDDEKDDYPDFYEVYLLPFSSEEELKANPLFWRNLSNSDHLGRITIAELGLDETVRKSFDGLSFEKWLSTRIKE